jgi:ATP-dependent helicase HrpB
MLLRGAALGLGGTACDLAAVLAERDVLRGVPGARDTDLRLRLELMRGDGGDLPAGLSVDRPALAQARRLAREWRRRLKLPARSADEAEAGILVALAYPDRIAQRRGPGLYRLSGGRGAALPAGDPLAAEDWLAVAALDAGGQDARIFLATPLTRSAIESAFADDIEETAEVAWDDREAAVIARRRRRLGALVLEEASLADPPAEEVAAAMLAGIRRLGLEALPWTPALRQWQARLRLLRALDGPAAWPDLDDAALLSDLEAWLAPHIGGVIRRTQLERIDLGEALAARLTWQQRRDLEAQAPTHLEVPSGSRLRLDYAAGPAPVLAVRLQEMFGATETPRIAGGRVPVVLHLLSPAGRPVQVTQDLAGFWSGSYAAVRRDLRGRYPKHPWPEDPLRAQPTARAKPRGT